MPRPDLKVIISGGGTGGHIFPAISIANAIKSRYPKADILFIGAEGRMEMEKVPAAGYPIEGLWISGLQRKLTVDNLSFPLKVASSLLKAHSILKHFKPDIAIGVGGFASGPLLYAASQRGIPCLIQEQNSYPGITNKLLARRVQKICVAYEGLEKFFPKEKIILTGNPIRSGITSTTASRNEAAEYFGINNELPVILVLGGSLGARTINNSIESYLKDNKIEEYNILWQCGKGYYQRLAEFADNYANPKLILTQFIDRMDLAYSLADVIISRAGAGSISELCVIGKPSILVPSPNVAEDHQTQNAMALVKNDAAVLIADADAAKNLMKEAEALLKDKDRKQQLGAKIKALAIPNAAERILNEIETLIK